MRIRKPLADSKESFTNYLLADLGTLKPNDLKVVESQKSRDSENRNLELESLVRQMEAELKNHDELYMKYKDLKLDYKQVVDTLEKSEELRRE